MLNVWWGQASKDNDLHPDGEISCGWGKKDILPELEGYNLNPSSKKTENTPSLRESKGFRADEEKKA